jgi:hypothetical protein
MAEPEPSNQEINDPLNDLSLLIGKWLHSNPEAFNLDLDESSFGLSTYLGTLKNPAQFFLSLFIRETEPDQPDVASIQIIPINPKTGNMIGSSENPQYSFRIDGNYRGESFSQLLKLISLKDLLQKPGFLSEEQFLGLVNTLIISTENGIVFDVLNSDNDPTTSFAETTTDADTIFRLISKLHPSATNTREH